MTTPSATPTPITPPRVPFFDERSGLISREWYMFFLGLFRTEQQIDDWAKSPQAFDASGEIAQAAQSAQLAATLRNELGNAAQDAQLSAQLSSTREELAALRTMVQGLAVAPPPREFKRARYGSFYDTTTQTAAVANTATAITFNTTDLSSGVRIGTTTSQVIVDTEGIYNFQTSIQLDSTVATDEEFYIWFRKNGVDVTDSASQVRVQGNNAEVFVALNYFFNLKANDYVELMYSVTDLGVQLLASGPVAPHPGIPSVILTVSNNIQGVQ
jgi:hypothetical protein